MPRCFNQSFRNRKLLPGRGDNTEIDMKVGELLIEAKLTESDFQVARPGLLTRYRDFDTVFEFDVLPKLNGTIGGYQLIRGALAAYALGNAFCVCCDARRSDLIEDWFRVLRAVRQYELKTRLKILTWQELANVLPAKLQRFLDLKYGIVES
jgi:hypothetical protein